AGNGAPSMATMQAVQQQLASLKAQLEKNPKDTDALTRLGDMYFDAGMFDKAADYYQKSLDLKPDDIMVMTDLGTSLRRLGQPQKALERFEETVKRDPNHWRGWFNIGVVSLYDLRQYDQAEAAFKKVDELKPGTIDMAELRKEIERVKAGGTGG
ncbi:MAG TPA: tetratricopeptide repeat protein, partial [Candidatus Saccharimonadales bacterium]|nr:tetratricopeptide repeat protein [Candidatus Saccharimonadales bacterium]